MQDNNTLKACYFTILDGEIHLDKKEYCWHIPKDLRAENIQKGDFVLVHNRDRKIQKIIVTDVFRENIEDTGKRYKSILSKAAPVIIK